MRHLLGSGPAVRGAALVCFLLLSLLRSVPAFAADTTAPTKPAVTDDGAYTTSTTSLHATWISSDPESGITEYQYLIRQDSTSGAIIVNWTSTGTTASVTHTGLNLIQGKKYYIGVKAKNGDGLWSSAGYSDGIKVDTTAPSAPGLPQEGSSTTDLDYDDNGSYTVYWAAASDGESGISAYEVQERVGPSGSWLSLTNSRTSTNFSVSGRLDKTTYFYQVRAKNKAGLWGPWSSVSDGILVDKTVPSAVTVTDDGVTTYSTTSLHATWTTSSDAESGIVEYQYRIRQDSTSGTVIVDWTSVGLSTAVTRTGLSLIVGKKYYIAVRAKNGAGLYSSIRYSDGILVQTDTTAPTSPVVTDDGPTTTSTIDLHATWTAASDPETGVAEYQYQIRQDDPTTGAIIRDWTSVGLVTATTATGLTLTVGKTYYLGVRAVNGAGMFSPIGYSDGITVQVVALPQTPWQTNAYGTLFTDLAYNYAMGYHFTPLVNGQVTGLGGYFNGTKTVKLFNKATGTLLASATVSAANTWAYTAITPVDVIAGSTYTVAVYLAGSGGSYRSGLSPALPRTFGDIRIESSTYDSTGIDPNTRPIYPSFTIMYGQADIQFVSATTQPDTTPPTINSVSPQSGPGLYAGDTLTILASVTDTDPSPLEYQFSVDGVIKQAWSATTTYQWVTTSTMDGPHTILVEVRDAGGAVSQTQTVYLYQKPPGPP